MAEDASDDAGVEKTDAATRLDRLEQTLAQALEMLRAMAADQAGAREQREALVRAVAKSSDEGELLRLLEQIAKELVEMRTTLAGAGTNDAPAAQLDQDIERLRGALEAHEAGMEKSRQAYGGKMAGDDSLCVPTRRACSPLPSPSDGRLSTRRGGGLMVSGKSGPGHGGTVVAGAARALASWTARREYGREDGRRAVCRKVR